MELLKEPKGVDFVIQSKPLTNKDREEISKFISEYKLKNNIKQLVNSYKKELV